MNKKLIIKTITNTALIIGATLGIIVSVILMCIMFFIRNKPKEVLDTNVREESIQHYNPNIP